MSKRRVKKRRSLTEYVRAARKWRRKLCKLAAVLQGKCTSLLVETEKNAHSQSNAVSFAVTIFLSGLTGSELRLFKNPSQSVSQSVRRRLTKICCFANFLFVFYRLSRVFLWVASADIACLSVDDAKGLLRCIFRVLRVSKSVEVYFSCFESK